MAITVRAGEFRHRVAFQTSTTVQDASGGYPEVWSTQFTMWAKISPISAKEHRDAEQTESTISHVIRLRAGNAITAQMRAVYGSRTFTILGVRDSNERGVKLEIDAVEVVTVPES